MSIREDAWMSRLVLSIKKEEFMVKIVRGLRTTVGDALALTIESSASSSGSVRRNRGSVRGTDDRRRSLLLLAARTVLLVIDVAHERELLKGVIVSFTASEHPCFIAYQ
jgi:hypothetical protein